MEEAFSHELHQSGIELVQTGEFFHVSDILVIVTTSGGFAMEAFYRVNQAEVVVVKGPQLR